MRGPAIRLALALLLAAGCSRAKEEGPRADATLARERAAALFERFDLRGAREALAPLVAGPRVEAEDLVRAAAVELALRELESAQALLERARRAGAADPAFEFLCAQVARESGRGEAALAHYRAVLRAEPEEHATRLAYAGALNELGRGEEAERELRALVDAGLENAGSFYVAALERQERLLRAAGRDEEARAAAERLADLASQGIVPPSERLLRLGSLGRLAPPPPAGSSPTPFAEPPRFERLPAPLEGLGDALELAAHDLDGDLRMDLVARSAAGLWVAQNRVQGFALERLIEGGVELVRAFDLDNDVDLDLLALVEGRPRFLIARAGRYELLELRHPELPSPPADALALDHDHDGDLDLLLVGEFGARLWRNDGAWVEGGAFTAVGGLESFAARGPQRWCASEDLDGDGDVDLLYGGEGGTTLADNLRAGGFADRSERLGAGLASRERPLVADLDADGRPDLWLAGTLWRQRAEGDYVRDPRAREGLRQAALLDLDLDGALDVAGDGRALLAAGLAAERAVALGGWPEGRAARTLAFADLDGDARIDALRADGAALALLAGRGPCGRALLVRLIGSKDNRRAVGALVELRAGPIYRRIYHRGEPELVGVGEREGVDVFRIRWPNGLVQTALDRGLLDYTMGAVSADSPPGSLELDLSVGEVKQEEQLIGSCPFLYTFDGEGYRFVTDVLGVTPLGLPMAPGVLVPFDHDEHVLVRGEELAPRDGRLEMQITEELREVTYLDFARLDVLDHPADTEVFPDERFSFPPFPAPRTHLVRDPLAPRSARGSDGRDWSPELAERDDRHALPFVKAPPQFQGLAEPWFLELDFDPTALEELERPLLVMTGWFRWSDASANVAAALHPGVDFVPPILQVPDGAGGWRDAGPPVGFPAGKTKTMVVELDALGLAGAPRLRIFSTLELYWDRIALAARGVASELRVRSLEPQSAELWQRGFSAPLAGQRPDQPERFDWSRLESHPRWDQHPGLYTRLGDVRELLLAIDDRFVILGAGDALHLAFDARAIGDPPAGFVRDYVLFLDGWAKDRDPNTLEALAVEPLPFHGMSTYPYPASERFPDGELHERWRREWNTRPARRWIESLVPRND